MPSDKIPRKRIRDSDSASDTDDAGPGIEQRRLPNTAYLDTPPPSSPARAQRSSLGDQRTRSRPLANVTFGQYTMREQCLMSIRKNYPTLDPVNLNDFELLTLSSAPYEGPVTGIQDWLKSEFDNIVQEEGGDASAILREATEVCNERTAAVGLKPPPYTPNALVRPVTGTEWSVRLWPASELHWCLDFVHTVTHAPKNKPFEFELWAVPLADPTLNTAPWLPLDLLATRLYSLEHGFGYKEEDIHEGEEKFVLMDGQTCALKRPGCRNIRFTVPNRCPVEIVDEDEVVEFELSATSTGSVISFRFAPSSNACIYTEATVDRSVPDGDRMSMEMYLQGN